MRRVKFLLLLVGVLMTSLQVSAQFFFNMGGGNRQMPEVTGTVRLEPADPVVGIPCAFVFSFSAKSKFEIQQVMGLPNRNIEYLSDTVEPYADGTYRLPVRFTAPVKETLTVVVGGMQTVETGNGTSFRSSYSTNFRKQMPTFSINVKPLPEDGKPADFTGAVGRRFDLKQTLTPDHVRPGDLVTATYELTFNGYCPSNIWPSVQRLSKEFKAYEPKEVSRTANKVTWTQVLVPRTVAATNSALVAFSYYNSFVGRYETAQARPQKLVFISAEAASTQNTSVTVTGETPTAAKTEADAKAPIQLHFAPSDQSPVIATLPPGTTLTELARQNGWRRVSTSKAVGWCK